MLSIDLKVVLRSVVMSYANGKWRNITRKLWVLDERQIAVSSPYAAGRNKASDHFDLMLYKPVAWVYPNPEISWRTAYVEIRRHGHKLPNE